MSVVFWELGFTTVIDSDRFSFGVTLESDAVQYMWMTRIDILFAGVGLACGYIVSNQVRAVTY